MRLDGKVALVTGGTHGIGAATAEALAQAGTDVALVARNDDDGAAQVRDRIAALGRRCSFIAADVSVPSEARGCVDRTATDLGRLDILVHCAGGPAGGHLMTVDPEVWHAAFRVHVHGAFYLCRSAVPWMQRAGEGAIVLVSSVAALRGVPGAVAYGTVKGAVLQFTRMAARDLADNNVRVNCVAPGIIRTRFHAAMTPEAREHNLRNRIPLHREGTPQDVAQVIVTLVTNDYITGECVVIDGGLTSRIA